MAVTQDVRFGTNVWGAGTDPWPARGGWNAQLALITGKATLFGEGTFAARPAFAAAKKGQVYWATDQQRLYYQSATAWTEVSPTGGGGASKDNAGRDGTEGTSRLAARADHTHPSENFTQRALFNGAGNPIGTWSSTKPTKTWVGTTIQTPDAHGLFDITIPETPTAVIAAVGTPYYYSNESIVWYPVLRGDHSFTNGVIGWQARRISDGGEYGSVRIGLSFAVTYQTN